MHLSIPRFASSPSSLHRFHICIIVWFSQPHPTFVFHKPHNKPLSLLNQCLLPQQPESTHLALGVVKKMIKWSFETSSLTVTLTMRWWRGIMFHWRPSWTIQWFMPLETMRERWNWLVCKFCWPLLVYLGPHWWVAETTGNDFSQCRRPGTARSRC